MPLRWRRRRRRGFDLATRAAVAGASVCAWRAASTCCCCCCITLPATAGRWRRCCAILRALCGAAGGAARRSLPPLPVQYADYTLWQQQVLGDESDPRQRDCAAAGVLAGALSGTCPIRSSCRATGRARRWRAIAGAACRCAFAASCIAGSRRLRATRERACSWCCRRRLPALLTRLGAGTDIAIGSPIAGRTDSALDDLVGFFVNTLVLRTDTSGNPSFARADWAGARGQSCGLQPSGLAVRAAGGGAQPGALAGAASAVPGDAGAAEQCAGEACELPGLDGRRCSRLRRASAKFDLSLSLAEQRGCGRHAGGDRRGHSNTPPTCSIAASVEALGGRLVRLLEAAVARPGAGDRPPRHSLCRGARRPSCAAGTTPRVRLPPADACRSCSRRRSTRTPDAIAVVFEDEALSYGELDARANRLAHHLRGLGRRPRGGGGAVPRALARHGDRASRHPQGGRRLSAARPDLSARAPRLHAGRCRRASAAHPLRISSIGCRSRASAIVRWIAIGDRSQVSPQTPPLSPSTRSNPPMSSTPQAPPDAEGRGRYTHAGMWRSLLAQTELCERPAR